MEKTTKFAIIKHNKVQYKVSEGAEIEVDKLEGKSGDKLIFSDVLLLSDGEKVSIGKPLVLGSKVTAEIIEQTKGPKVDIFKFKSKARYRRRAGHRQQLTKIKINKIQ